MTDSQQPPAPESSGAAPAKKTSKVRRISNPLLKKTRKQVQAKVMPPPEPVDSREPKTTQPGDAPMPPAPVENQLSETTVKPATAAASSQSSGPTDPAPADPATANAPAESSSDEAESTDHEWPEPEPASSGRQEGQESNKRKRRRKKNKNHQQAQQTQQALSDDSDTPQIATIVESSESNKPTAPIAHPPRQRQDPEVVAKYAWKIYLAEVSEEGVALIGDHDAKDLARRCFRLAEIFLEEQTRRR